MIKCFFFDRDGVLIKDYGYFFDKSKIKWLKGAINSIKILKRKKIKVIVVTNQSGIARGFFKENDLNKFHEQMNLELKKKNAKIDKFYFCPFHPNGSVKKYSKKSNLRKPNNGMILQALNKFNLKNSECFMIGDKRSDYLCAKKSNIKFEYKKKYSLEKQINNILNSSNDI